MINITYGDFGSCDGMLPVQECRDWCQQQHFIYNVHDPLIPAIVGLMLLAGIYVFYQFNSEITDKEHKILDGFYLAGMFLIAASIYLVYS